MSLFATLSCIQNMFVGDEYLHTCNTPLHNLCVCVLSHCKSEASTELQGNVLQKVVIDTSVCNLPM